MQILPNLAFATTSVTASVLISGACLTEKLYLPSVFEADTPQLTPGTLGCGEPEHIRPKCPNVRILEGCHPLNTQRHYFWQERYSVTKFDSL